MSGHGVLMAEGKGQNQSDDWARWRGTAEALSWSLVFILTTARQKDMV
jgi:hypothetical protein